MRLLQFFRTAFLAIPKIAGKSEKGKLKLRILSFGFNED